MATKTKVLCLYILSVYITSTTLFGYQASYRSSGVQTRNVHLRLRLSVMWLSWIKLLRHKSTASSKKHKVTPIHSTSWFMTMPTGMFAGLLKTAGKINTHKYCFHFSLSLQYSIFNKYVDSASLALFPLSQLILLQHRQWCGSGG